jgi:hypothetical protein
MRSNADIWNEIEPFLKELVGVPREAAFKLQKESGMKSLGELRDLAKRLGIPVIKTSKLSPKVSGLATKQGEECLIVVNSQESKRRQEFTIAHEMGHIALDHSENDEAASATQELQATMFSSILLLATGTNHEELEKYFRENPEAALVGMIPLAIVGGFGLFVIGRFAVETICKLLSNEKAGIPK